MPGQDLIMPRPSKKRRLPRACDHCRQKKIRCNSEEMPGKQCSRCIKFNLECTHFEALNSMGTAKSYVQQLESRLDRFEKLFSQLLPHLDIEQEIDHDSKEGTPETSGSDGGTTPGVAQFILTPNEKYVFGKSSMVHTIAAAFQMKARRLGKGTEIDTESATLSFEKREEFWKFESSSFFRPPSPSATDYTFPDDALMVVLIDRYFRNENSYLPLIHRPTFENAVAGLLHLHDRHFGAVVLLVCALGSRHSQGFVDNTGEVGSEWFRQVASRNPEMDSNRGVATLYEVQIHALSVMYLQYVGLCETAWARIGLAIRRVLEAGAHIHKETFPNAEDELWKRAFWVLFVLDTSSLSMGGFPVSLDYGDFDVDLPIECDDEYWDSFVQPAGKPSRITFFVALLKLMEILVSVQRNVYPTRKPLVAWSRCPSDHELHSAFDTLLRQWSEQIPSHLVWNPDTLAEDETFSHQSGFLHITYNYIRVLVHRPSVLQADSILHSPSAAVCAQAAYSCLDVVAQMKKCGYVENPHCVSYVASIVMTLVLIMYAKGEPTHADTKRIYAALDMLQCLEKIIPPAGAFWDILADLTLTDVDQNLSGRRSLQPGGSDDLNGVLESGRRLEAGTKPPRPFGDVPGDADCVYDHASDVSPNHDHANFGSQVSPRPYCPLPFVAPASTSSLAHAFVPREVW